MRTLPLAIALVLGVCRGATDEPPADDAEAAEQAAAAEQAPARTGCSSDADCPADHLCEGEACDGPRGTCAPKDRMCTRDAQLYCACNGTEFRASGSCPGQIYRNRGPCDAESPPP